MARIQVGGGGSAGAVTESNLVIGQAPNESPNGSRVLFTLPTGYKAGKLMVFRAGERIFGVTETSPPAGTFTLTIAPLAVEAIKCDYIKA